MWKSRLRYFLVLLGTSTFFICFNGYLSLYLWVLSLLLPVVSLLVSLPGMLGTRASLSAGETGAPSLGPERGRPFLCSWKSGTPHLFPVGGHGHAFP